MKRLAFLFVCMFMLNLVALAAHDKPIKFEEMPKQAQQFVNKYFAQQSVALIKMETDFMSKSYDVIFTNGDKVEFDKRGHWTKIECEQSAVPTELIPDTILGYVQKQYPSAKVLKIEKTDRKGYEIDLSNGVDIEFDKKLNVIDIDR